MKRIPRFIAPLTFRESFDAWGAQSDVDSSNEFQRQFCSYIGGEAAVFAPSARVALAAVLNALSLPKGGEVIIPSLTFHAFPYILRDFGLQPRFVDIDPTTYCLDVAQMKEAVTEKTVAIMPVHLYGRACDMNEVCRLAEKHNLTIIEDVAQACGGLFDKKRLGSYGRASIFSFGPTKNLSALWCGMVVTDSQDTAEKVSAYMTRMPVIGKANLAWRWATAMAMRMVTRPLFWHAIMVPALWLGMKAGFDPIDAMTSEEPRPDRLFDKQAQLMPQPFQARLALSQLSKLDAANELRKRNGDLLIELLTGTPGLGIPAKSKAGESIYSTFVVTVDERQKFRQRLLARGVDSTIGNMHVGPLMPGMHGAGEYKNAQDAVARMVHLPVYPQMSEGDIAYVAQAVRAAVQAN